MTAQDSGLRLAVPLDRHAEFDTRSPEEAEFAVTLLSAKPVHFLRDRQNVETIEIVAGHGKPQNGKMPCAQYPLTPFDRSGIHCDALFIQDRH